MKEMTNGHKHLLPPKVKFISECCEAVAVVGNENADGSGDDYYICSECNQPCELIGYIEK